MKIFRLGTPQEMSLVFHNVPTCLTTVYIRISLRNETHKFEFCSWIHTPLGVNSMSKLYDCTVNIHTPIRSESAGKTLSVSGSELKYHLEKLLSLYTHLLAR